MINSDEFSKRLQDVMDYYAESASSFSEKIGVQRSSISHILSGRNKPSLDFVLKVLSAFPEVELYWLLNGKGDFPSRTTSVLPHGDASQEKRNDSTDIPKFDAQDKSIEKIVIFYKDGTFKDFVKD